MPEGQDEQTDLLLQMARQGDAEAFGQLYERFAPQVFRYLYAHLDERWDAEDLTEEVFLRVWQALPAYRERGAPFYGFLFRVARNALYDHYRRAHRRNANQPLDEELGAEHASNLSTGVDLHLEHQELRRVLNQLREDQRTVLVLRFLVGLSPAQVGQAMGKSNGAVRVLQHRALLEVRKILSREE